MRLHTEKAFGHAVSGNSVLRSKDPPFDAVDTLMTETQARSLPEIAQSAWFEQEWSSISESFENSQIGQYVLHAVFVRYVPTDYVRRRVRVGIDTACMARPRSRTVRDRCALLLECRKPITRGRQFSTVVALPDPASRSTSVLDQQRLTTETAVAQLALALLKRAGVVLDRGYNATWLWCHTLQPIGPLVRRRDLDTPGRPVIIAW